MWENILGIILIWESFGLVTGEYETFVHFIYLNDDKSINETCKTYSDIWKQSTEVLLVDKFLFL
jgi:hypothetical protein